MYEIESNKGDLICFFLEVMGVSKLFLLFKNLMVLERLALG